MSAATGDTKPKWVLDLLKLVEELRAEDDALVAAGHMPPHDEEQAIRLGLKRPSLSVIRGGRDEEGGA